VELAHFVANKQNTTITKMENAHSKITTVLGNRALVEPVPPKLHLFGIVTPQNYSEALPTSDWKIIRLGVHKDMPPELKEGQTVIVNHRMGSQEIRNVKARIISTMDILAIKDWPDELEA